MVCVLGVTQSKKDGTQGAEASRMDVFADYFGTNQLVLGPDSNPSKGYASFPANEEPAPRLPEPATMMLFGLGLLGLATFFKRRFK